MDVSEKPEILKLPYGAYVGEVCFDHGRSNSSANRNSIENHACLEPNGAASKHMLYRQRLFSARNGDTKQVAWTQKESRTRDAGLGNLVLEQLG